MIMNEPKEFERKYTVNYLDHSHEWSEDATFRQNTEVPDKDHWRVKLFLKRWRTASELANYLRWAADQVKMLAEKTTEQPVIKKPDHVEKCSMVYHGAKKHDGLIICNRESGHKGFHRNNASQFAWR